MKGLRLVGGTDSKPKRKKRQAPDESARKPHRKGSAQHPLYNAESVDREAVITQVMALSAAGLTVRNIALQLGIPRSTVNGYQKQAFDESRSLESRHRFLEQRVIRQMRLIQAYWVPAIGQNYFDERTQKQVTVPPDPDAAKIVMMADDRIASTLALDHKTVDLAGRLMPPKLAPFEGWTGEEISRWRIDKTVPPGKEAPRRQA
jgi:hypothetical protein